MDEELEMLRKKRMMELMKSQSNTSSNYEALQEQQMKDAIAMMEKEIRQYLDDKAYERLNNIKLVNMENATKVIYLLYQLKMTGRLNKRLSDEEFKRLLLQITPKKREPKIMRR